MIKKVFENTFLVFALISVFSYGFLAYNIQNQGIDIDEVFHHGFSMTYFDLVMEGELSDPCITGQGDCNKIDLTCAGEIQWVASGGILKGILVGLGDYFFSDSERIYYASSNVEPCRPIHFNQGVIGENTPTQTELEAARFFSPIFGALSVGISFCVGKLLFNRFVGISFATVLLFHGLWIHHSRIITSEVYVNFFIILAIYLLLFSSNKNTKTAIKFLIFSAITFALAINTKITALEVFPFIILAIFIRQPFNQNIELKKLFNKKNFSKSLLLSLLFIGIFFAALFSTFPFYYPDPISQLTLQFNVLQEYGAITEPSTHIKKIFLPFVASATIAPIIDGYYHIFEPDNIPDSTKSGHTFSSIPLALFFMIGIVYILFAIKRKKLSYAEFLILFWYASIYLILTASIESYNTSRHFIPLVFPMIVIASYAIWKFLVPLKNKIKIPFFGLSIFSHAVTFLIFWKEIYFEPSVVWTLPVIFEYNQWCALSGECMRQAINMKESLNNPVVLFSGIVFLVIVLIIYINKNKKLTTDKLKKI